MDNLLGIAVCDECDARVRVLEKHRSLIGKAVRCPKCHSTFNLVLEEATQNELIAIESEKEAEQKKQTRKRRSRFEIRSEHIQRCMDGFRILHARLKAISDEPKSSEEQVRVWCIDALRSALGYDDSEIDTERRVLNNRVDIAIKDENIVKVVIECKNMRSRLRSNVRDQAGTYAATLSAPWAVVTNGDIWKLYRVTQIQGSQPKLELVFDLALLDEDGISDADAENLYLLTERAMTSGDTEREYHQVIATSPARVYDSLFSDRVLAAVRLEICESYREDHQERIKLDEEDVRAALHELLTPLNL